MKIGTFELERGQSLWEHEVDINLSESGVHPVSLAELRDMGMDLELLEQTPLMYIQTNGSVELRERLSALYPGSTIDHIEVTNGTSEANYLLAQVVLDPGDRMLFQTPNYLQVSGIARHLGADVVTFSLRHDRGWEPDWRALEQGLKGGARLVYVSHPNNPTGYVMAEAAMDRLVGLVEAAGAYLLADEVYRGTEWSGEISPGFWGRSERVLVTSGLSKAYGIPGARIGWLVGPQELVARCWSHHDYTTIAPGALSDLIARFAIEPENRRRLFARGRKMMGANHETFRAWVETFAGGLDYLVPSAGAYAFVRYRAAMGSVELADRIRERQSVLLVPGAWTGMEHYLRFGLGGPGDLFERGLGRVKVELDAILAPAEARGA